MTTDGGTEKKYVCCLIGQLVEKGRGFTNTGNQLPITTSGRYLLF